MEGARRISRRPNGLTLIEILIAALVIGATAVVFCTALSMASLTATVASQDTIAITCAREKMEQIKGLDFADLDYAGLLQHGLIDPYPDHLPYRFTYTENLHQDLRESRGELQIRDLETDIRQVCVSIRWTDARGHPRTVSLISQTTDR
jgi:type II secretory pathway pseudopilin PulG